MGFQFPDAAMSGRPMKADYINDLRSKINIARGQVGQPPISWGPDVNKDDVVRASHIKDIRDAIRNLWLTKNLISQSSQFPGFANGEPNNLTALFASQTSDPRLWLNQAANVPSLQGLNSIAYHPTTYGGNAYVSQAWAEDIKGLHDANDNKRVRAVRFVARKGPSQSLDQHDIQMIVNDCKTYGIGTADHPSYEIYMLLHKESFDNGFDQNTALTTIGGISSTNNYIEGLSSSMASFMKTLFDSDAHVSKFIIWNEPNNYAQSNKKMEPDRFAAILRRTWTKTQLLLGSQMANSLVKLYWGGIHIIGDSAGPSNDEIDWIKTVYDQLINQKASDTSNPSIADYGRQWPWHGINVHIHHDKSDTFCQGLYNRLYNEVQVPYSDLNDVLLGEWGIQLTGSEGESFPTTPSGNLVPTFNAFRLKFRPTAMFYFSHDLSLDTSNNTSWGLRRYWIDPSDGAYRPCDDSASPACDDKTGRLGGLYDAYQEALDQQAQ